MKKYKVTFKKIIVVEEIVVDAENKQDAFFTAAEKVNKDYDGYPSIKEIKERADGQAMNAFGD